MPYRDRPEGGDSTYQEGIANAIQSHHGRQQAGGLQHILAGHKKELLHRYAGVEPHG